VRNKYAYGLDQTTFASVISTEYLALRGTIYLDHDASPPTPPSVVQSNTFALIHIPNLLPRIQLPSKSIAFAQESYRSFSASKTLRVTNNVIFTAGATAALKLFDETFPWNGPTSWYQYFKDWHTSLVGI
jgi:selenocysteine lyase/cysteine desulfurase